VSAFSKPNSDLLLTTPTTTPLPQHPKLTPNTVVVCPDKCNPATDGKDGKPHLHYTHLVDAWAVGVLAYELTVGRAPFDAGNKRATIDQILNGHPTYPSWMSEQARHFVTWSLTKDATQRPDVPELAYHPWVTSYAARSRPKMTHLRAAASAMDLRALGGMASDNHMRMEARHKALVAGHVGSPGGLQSSDSADDEEHLETVAAALMAEVTVSGSSDASSSGEDAVVLTPFSAAAAQCGDIAAAAAAGGGGIGIGGVIATAETLRAYVHRCQSMNNLESLRAAVLMQPPEPSNACFEPGGRFYNPNGRPAAAHPTPQRPAPAPPAAATAAVQHHQAVAVADRVLGAHSAASSASGGSPKPNRSPTPPLPPGAPVRPPAVQVVRMPSASAPVAAAAAAHALGTAAATAKHPGSPACGQTRAPITPDLGAPPRLQLFASSSGKCALNATAAGAMHAPQPCGVKPRGGSGSVSSADSLGGDAPAPASTGTSDGSSSCGSRAEYASVSSSGGASNASAMGALTTTTCGSLAPLLPPQPVSPPSHSHSHSNMLLVRDAVINGAQFAASKAAAAVASASDAAKPIAQSVLLAVGGGGGSSAGCDEGGDDDDVRVGGDDQGGGMSWFTMQCANFLKLK